MTKLDKIFYDVRRDMKLNIMSQRLSPYLLTFT